MTLGWPFQNSLIYLGSIFLFYVCTRLIFDKTILNKSRSALSDMKTLRLSKILPITWKQTKEITRCPFNAVLGLIFCCFAVLQLCRGRG